MIDLVFLSATSHGSGDSAVGIFLMLLFLFFSVIGLIGKGAKAAISTAWDKGFFPKDLPGTRDNILEAYIALAALMIRADRRDMGDKVVYMNKYFNKYFPNSIYNFGDSLVHFMKNPMQPSSVASWLLLKLNKSQRLQVMYFLAGLSAIDGSIGSRERAILEELREYMHITPKEYESVIAMYTQKRSRSSSSRPNTSSHSKKSAVQLASQVLGVSEHASMDEVKKAYRRLVKIHHPDRFTDESKEQQEIAEERFIEIQKAYEILEKFK